MDDAQLREIMQTQSPTIIKQKLTSSEAAVEGAQKQPKPFLSLAIYQAAYIAYLEQLSGAISTSKDITPDEKVNAKAVFDSPFKQFSTSLVFVMVPLAHLARQDMKDAGDEDEMVKNAISKAWESFFETRVLTRQ